MGSLFGLVLSAEVLAALSDPNLCDGKREDCRLAGVCGQRCVACAQLLCDCRCESSETERRVV